MRKVFKGLLALLFVCILSAQLFAAEGTVTYIKGKVEVKRGESWVSLRIGDKVAQSEIISTGFQSEAKVKLMDSVLYLGPVTRVSLDQLSSSSDKDKVNVYLSTGTVRSKVNRTNNKSVSYTVRTPIAVASVRGTDFSMGSDGTLKTNQGSVSYSPEVADEDDDKSSDDEKKSDDESEDKGEGSDKGDSDAKADSKDSSDKNSDAEDGEKSSSSSKNGDAEDGKKSSSSKKNSDAKDSKKSSSSKDSESSASGVDSVKSEVGAKGSSDDSGFKQSKKAASMASSEKLPNRETVVRNNQSINAQAVRKFGGVVNNTAAVAMNVASAVSTESSKSAVGQTNTSVMTSVSDAIAGNVTTGPKTGSIKVIISEPAAVVPVPPSTGNVSVEVVLPK